MGNELLAIAAAAAVTLRVSEMRNRGGPTDADWDKAKAFAPVLAEKGDLILYRSNKPGESADLFNRLVHAVAVLSFVPGGITLFGVHWDGK